MTRINTDEINREKIQQEKTEITEAENGISVSSVFSCSKNDAKSGEPRMNANERKCNERFRRRVFLVKPQAIGIAIRLRFSEQIVSSIALRLPNEVLFSNGIRVHLRSFAALLLFTCKDHPGRELCFGADTILRAARKFKLFVLRIKKASSVSVFVPCLIRG